MPTLGRAAALRAAAEGLRLYVWGLRLMPSAPWDLDALAALRTPHAETLLYTGAPGDVQVINEIVCVAGTATLRHPAGLADPVAAYAVAVVSYHGGEVTLYGVAELSPPAVTAPDAPEASVPLSLWDSFPGGG